jgi:GTP-binding protein
MSDFDYPEDSRAGKTKSRQLNRFKKNKHAKGRAFRDPVGYGGMQVGLEAGLSPARAMRKAEKLKPKKFSGKVAMYYANESNMPVPVITEQNLEQMPQPNTIRTLKGVHVSTDALGHDPTSHIIDFVSSAPKKIKREALQKQLDEIFDPARLRHDRIDELPSTSTSTFQRESDFTSELEQGRDAQQKDDPENSSLSALAREREEDDLEEFDDDDMDDEELDDYAPRKVSPDEDDLNSMTPTTRAVVNKVRSVFSGSLQWYQPVPGELSEIFLRKESLRADLPSQRTALTSASATSVRNILVGTATTSMGSPRTGLPEPLLEGKILVKKGRNASKTQPRQFFDHKSIEKMASQDFVKAKRSGSENSTALHEVLKLPQICVVGRSNVGKSSLLNAIMGPKFNKMQVSSKPGKTQMIQMLAVSQKLAVVDMPGYGYAAATPQAKRAMEERIGEYLMTKLPKRVFILIDSRRGLGNADIRLADSLETLKIVYQVVLTKTDKIRNVEQMAMTEKNIRDWLRRRSCGMPEVIKTSSRDRDGIDQFRLAIYTSCGLDL